MTDQIFEIGQLVKPLYETFIVQDLRHNFISYVDKLFVGTNSSPACRASLESDLQEAYKGLRKSFSNSSFFSYLDDIYIVENFNAILASDVLHSFSTPSVFMSFMDQVETKISNLTDAINALKICANRPKISSTLDAFTTDKFNTAFGTITKLFTTLSSRIKNASVFLETIPRPIENVTPDFYR